MCGKLYGFNITAGAGGLLSPAIKDYSSGKILELIAQDFLTLCKKQSEGWLTAVGTSSLAPAAY